MTLLQSSAPIFYKERLSESLGEGLAHLSDTQPNLDSKKNLTPTCINTCDLLAELSAIRAPAESATG